MAIYRNQLTRIASMFLLIGLGASSTTIAESLFRGTLITTETQREMIDQLKFNHQSLSPKAITPTTPPTVNQSKDLQHNTKKILFNGLVTNNDGAHTIWINGQWVELEKSKQYLVDKSQDRKIWFINSQGQKLALKPGQTIQSSDSPALESFHLNGDFQKHD